MSVLASFCRVCALPLQHDHYVPTAGGMLKIFRSGREGTGQTWEDNERPFEFGPEHAWLTDVVALSQFGEEPPFARGEVHDGGLFDVESGEELFVGDSDEGHLLLHAACWERSGKPESAADQPVAVGTHEWAQVAPYHEQLFEFRQLADDGKSWMLVDPSGSSDAAVRSRARIDSLIAAAHRPLPEDPPDSVAAVLRADRGWIGRTVRDNDAAPLDLVRYRADLDPSLERAAYPVLVGFKKAYEGDALGRPNAATLEKLEAFEVALKTAVEADDAAILVTVTLGHHKGQYIIYAKDEAATRARIDALPGRDDPQAGKYENEPDPTWKVFFEDLNPFRLG